MGYERTGRIPRKKTARNALTPGNMSRKMRTIADAMIGGAVATRTIFAYCLVMSASPPLVYSIKYYIT
jgi:hypothetical protein